MAQASEREVPPIDEFPLMRARLTRLAQKGFRPGTIYDIGSHHGRWTQMVRGVWPEARVEMFEADADTEAHKRDLPAGVASHTVLLGASAKENVPFYKCGLGLSQGNSLFLEQTQFFAPGNFSVARLRQVPLDAFIEERKLPPPNLLKLDVQGGELQVLAGGARALAAAAVVLLEVALHQYNSNAPLFAEVVDFMAKKGFQMIDVAACTYIDGDLAQLDALFARAGGPFCRADFSSSSGAT